VFAIVAIVVFIALFVAAGVFMVADLF